MCETPENLTDLAQEKLDLGKDLLEKIDNLAHVHGIAKIGRKICSEISFLEKVKM